MINQGCYNQNSFNSCKAIGGLFGILAGSTEADNHHLKGFAPVNSNGHLYLNSNRGREEYHNLILQSTMDEPYGRHLSAGETLNILLQEHDQEVSAINTAFQPSPMSLQSAGSFDSRAVSPLLPYNKIDDISFTDMMATGIDPSLFDPSLNQNRLQNIAQELLQQQQQQHQLQIQRQIQHLEFIYRSSQPRSNQDSQTTNADLFVDPFGGSYMGSSQNLDASFNPNNTNGLTGCPSMMGYNTPTAGEQSSQPIQKKNNSPKTKKPAKLQCASCDKVFSRPYNLKSHQKTHTKEKPYACTHPGCNWSFARPHDLKRHALCLHEGIKPYSCPCGRNFARSDAFKRHQTVDVVCATKRKTQGLIVVQ